MFEHETFPPLDQEILEVEGELIEWSDIRNLLADQTRTMQKVFMVSAVTITAIIVWSIIHSRRKE